MRRCAGAGAILLLLAGLALGGDGDEYDAWVDALASRRFPERQEAYARLKAAGLDAREALLRGREHASAEVRTRAAELLAALGLLSEAKEEVWATEIERLTTAEEAAERTEALRRIVALGSVATERLRERLAVTPDEVAIEAGIGVPWIESTMAGRAKLSWCVRVANASKRTLFVPRKHAITSYSRSTRGLVPRRGPNAFSIAGGGGGAVFGRSGRPTLETLVARCAPLAPGDSIELRVIHLRPALSFPGWKTVRWTVPLGLTLDVGGTKLDVGYAPASAKDRLRASGRVLVLPDLGEATSPGGVEAKIARSNDAEPKAGEPLPVTLTLTNRGDDPARLDRDWARYAWVFVGHRQQPATYLFEAAKSLAADPDERRPAAAEEERPAFELAPGASVSLELAVPIPEDATGPGWLISAAYENLEGDANADGTGADGFLHGRVLAPPHEVDLPD